MNPHLIFLDFLFFKFKSNFDANLSYAFSHYLLDSYHQGKLSENPKIQILSITYPFRGVNEKNTNGLLTFILRLLGKNKGHFHKTNFSFAFQIHIYFFHFWKKMKMKNNDFFKKAYLGGFRTKMKKINMYLECKWKFCFMKVLVFS